MNEEWKELKKVARFGRDYTIISELDYTECGYKISNKGRLMNRHDKILGGTVSSGGYRWFTLRDCDSVQTRASCHQLVAQYFMPEGIMNEMSVDHIDRDKLNNSVENLRWVKHADNCKNRDFFRKKDMTKEYCLYLEELLTSNNILFDKKKRPR